MSSPALFSLAGKNVLITGATRGTPSDTIFHIYVLNHWYRHSGIGAACAIALAEAGASICLVQRQPPAAGEPNTTTLDAIIALGATAKVVHCDLDDMDAVKQVFQKALDVMGGQIHILVNCAGIQRRSPSVDFPESDWDEVGPTPFICKVFYAHVIAFFIPLRFWM